MWNNILCSKIRYHDTSLHELFELLSVRNDEKVTQKIFRHALICKIHVPVFTDRLEDELFWSEDLHKSCRPYRFYSEDRQRDSRTDETPRPHSCTCLLSISLGPTRKSLSERMIFREKAGFLFNWLEREKNADTLSIGRTFFCLLWSRDSYWYQVVLSTINKNVNW